MHPETPEEGQLLEDLFSTTPENVRAMVKHQQATALDLGLPFGDRTRTYNSRLAQELGLWADDHGCGDEFHMQTFRAYFEKGYNISKRSVLLDLAENAGLNRLEAEKILQERRYRDKVDHDWEDCRRNIILAAPSLVIGSRRLVGAQPYENLQQFVLENNVKEKKVE